MRSRGEPYPVLQLFNRQYRFESKTEGTYQSEDGPNERITWDYWDEAHLWNMALETWSNGKLSVYSTREVQPEDFSELRKESETLKPMPLRESASTATFGPQFSWTSRQSQFIMAWGLVVFGFCLMILGV